LTGILSSRAGRSEESTPIEHILKSSTINQSVKKLKSYSIMLRKCLRRLLKISGLKREV